METKRYSSYAQIERELEILKIEKEISYKKMIFGVQKTKESFTPQNIVSNLIGSYSNAIPYGTIFSSAVPFILNKAIPFLIHRFTIRKRGN